MFEFIPIIVALVGVGISSYTDFKTGYVPDKLSHFMILFGVIWVALFIPFNQAVIVYLIAGAVFAIGFLAYIFGQFGGGDVKLFTALALLIPFYPEAMANISNYFGIVPATSSPYPFVFSVFLFAGIIGPMFIVAINYFIRLYKIKKKVKDFDKKLTIGLIYSIIIIPFIGIWFMMSPGMGLLFIPMITTFLILPFKNDILKHFSIQRKKIKDLDDDDVIALEFISEKTKKKLGLWRKTFTSHEIKKVKAKAKRAKINTVFVCEDLPKFVPFIFISLIVNLLVGDILFYLLISF